MGDSGTVPTDNIDSAIKTSQITSDDNTTSSNQPRATAATVSLQSLPNQAASLAPSQAHQLRARALTFTVKGRTLIDHVDFQVKDTGVSTILGFNGAGKSLLLRLLHGLITPTHGELLWGDEKVETQHRKRQAMVFQKPVLLRRNTLDNVLFALKSRGSKDKQKAEALLERFELSSVATQPARLLSGGEAQRLALARAMATEPDVLFLDEATASLDPASTAKIESLIREICDVGTKVIMVTHDLGLARRLSAEILFLDRGTIVEQSDASSFFNVDNKNHQPMVNNFLAGELPDY